MFNLLQNILNFHFDVLTFLIDVTTPNYPSLIKKTITVSVMTLVCDFQTQLHNQTMKIYVQDSICYFIGLYTYAFMTCLSLLKSDTIFHHYPEMSFLIEMQNTHFPFGDICCFNVKHYHYCGERSGLLQLSIFNYM